MGDKLVWFRVTDAVPPKGKRVLVMSDKGWSAGRLTRLGWRDDNSLPIHGVTEWTEVVAHGETV